MKKIVGIIFIAICGLFMFSCTNESEIENTTKYNNKSTENESDEFTPRTYHQYEENNYTDDEIISIMTDFCDLINNNEVTTSEYDIKRATFAMETFFNAAIVNKQDKFDTTSYDKKTFDFSMNFDVNGEINANDLRDKYIPFLNNILLSMGDKFLQLSDIYVKNITSTSITFGLEIPPLSSKFYGSYSALHELRSQRVRNINEQYPVNQILSGNTSDWNSYTQDQVDEQMRIHSKIDIYNTFILNNQPYYYSFSNYLPSNWTLIWPIFLYANGATGCWDFTYNSIINYNGRASIVNGIITRLNNYFQSHTPDQSCPTCIDVFPTFHQYIVTDTSSDCYKKRYVYGYIKQINMGKLSSITINNFLVNVTFNRDLF